MEKVEKTTLSISKEYHNKLRRIAKANYTDMSKMIRKWIDEEYKEEYQAINID